MFNFPQKFKIILQSKLFDFISNFQFIFLIFKSWSFPDNSNFERELSFRQNLGGFNQSFVIFDRCNSTNSQYFQPIVYGQWSIVCFWAEEIRINSMTGNNHLLRWHPKTFLRSS